MIIHSDEGVKPRFCDFPEGVFGALHEYRGTPYRSQGPEEVRSSRGTWPARKAREGRCGGARAVSGCGRAIASDGLTVWASGSVERSYTGRTWGASSQLRPVSSLWRRGRDLSVPHESMEEAAWLRRNPGQAQPPRSDRRLPRNYQRAWGQSRRQRARVRVRIVAPKAWRCFLLGGRLGRP